jgi:hypothetical protein
LIVHAVKLVARENQVIVILTPGKSMQMLPDGIGCPLKPIGIGHCLLRSEDFDESLREGVESECRRDVVIERSGIELCQNKQSLQTGIQAVADWNINEAVLSTERHRRFGPILSQREQPLSGASRQNY